jgi:hypothetical protein
MAMIDTFKYEQRWYVHGENDAYYDGEEYISLDGATEAAKTEAAYGIDNYVYVVTEVLIRQVKRTQTIVKRTVEIEDI